MNVTSTIFLKFRVKFRLEGQRYFRDVAALDTFDARIKVLISRGLDKAAGPEDQMLKPTFEIYDVSELPLDYEIESSNG